MDATTPEWLEPLKRHLVEVIRPPTGPTGKARLLEALTALGDLLSRHEKEMPNELVHYLQRRSYEKAFKFCDKVESVGCGD
jgi:hypothetical protein